MTVLQELIYGHLLARQAKEDMAAYRRKWGHANGVGAVTPWAPQGVDAKIVPFLGSGLSSAEVARRIGVSRTAVFKSLRRLGATLK